MKYTLTDFLARVDEYTKGASKQALADFIHLRARHLPQGARNDFLKELTRPAGTQNQHGSERHLAEKKTVLSDLKRIEDSEIMLYQECDYEYDEWYDDGEEYEYNDPDGVLDVIQRACAVLHEMINKEMYADAREIADRLCKIEISVSSEWDTDLFDLQRLCDESILDIDIGSLTADIVYVVYNTEKAEDRAEAVYSTVTSFGHTAFRLESVMQRGSHDLPDADKFLLQWIDCLGSKSSTISESLIKDAFALITDSVMKEQIASRLSKVHPCLYEQMLISEEWDDAGEKLRIGLKAMDEIPEKLVIRGRIAVIAADAACELGDNILAEKCLFEAYRSDTSPKNYLRLAAASSDYTVYREDMCSVFEDVYRRAFDKERHMYGAREMRENHITEYEYYTLLFLNGSRERMITEGMSAAYPLGWSSTFMKQGIALFMLLLYDRDILTLEFEIMLGHVIEVMRADIVHSHLSHEDPQIQSEQLWERFKRWKSYEKISEDEARSIIARLEAWVDIRTSGIIDKCRRNYYGECAAFIAALGVLRESRGYGQTKKQFMESYRKKYPRHTAFRSELKVYGLQ